MKKILLSISNHSFMIGGGEHSYIELLTNLPESWIPDAIVPDEGQVLNGLSDNGIESKVVPLPQIKPWGALKVFNCILCLFRLYNNNKPNLIYANGPRAAFYGGILGKLINVPVIWHCRISEPDPLMDYILNHLCKRVVANSLATSKRFGPRYRSKIRIVYNGINTKRFQKNNIKKPIEIDQNWKIIIHVARVSKMKRHDLAITAFEKAAKHCDNLHFVCVGDKDISDLSWWDYLQKRTGESRFHEQIHWVGHVDDVRPWYHAADLLIFPAENEAFGRVLVEAMACGVPVIATSGGGVPEIVRNDQEGILVSPGETNEMANAINRILNDDMLKDRLAQTAMKRADLFSLEIHVKKMVEVFDDILKG